MVAIKNTKLEAIEEWMELTPPASSILIAPILATLFGITKTSPKDGVEMSDPSIEVGVDAKLVVESISHSIKEGEIGSDEEAPLLS